MSSHQLYPLLTRDPASGDELIVTRLECPSSGTTIEGRFTLGWIGALTPDQLDFVGLLLKHRNNLQKLATELGVAYNTARSRLDDVVGALGGPREPDAADTGAREAIDKLASGELDFDEALAALKKRRG
jgi:hypothetical protein